MSKLYRRTALERLSSPDRLDCMLTVTSPLTWMAVAAAAIICAAVVIWAIFGYIPNTEIGTGVLVNAYNTNTIYSDFGGQITKLLVKQGDFVETGIAVAEIKTADGTNKEIYSNHSGIVTELLIETGVSVNPLSEIIRISPKTEDELVAVCYVPLSVSKQLKPGMKANVYLNSADSGIYGYIESEITNIDSYIASQQSMCSILGEDGQMALQITQSGPLVAVTCDLDNSNSSVSGYNFTSNKGNDLKVSCGELITVQLEISKSAPITRVFPALEG